jgi:DNA-binding SARP family transcriptional activator
LRIRLFGSLDLERDGRALDRFSSRKARDLFAYLALQRQSAHGRDHLAGIFWGDSSDDKARHALNTTLWRIHRVLGGDEGARQNGCLRVSQHDIAFNMAGELWLDVAEFESRCVAAEQTTVEAERFALYQQAVSFYRGDLLTDCYEDWCIVERERLQSIFVRALSRLMAHYAQRAEHEQAIECGRRILGCDPLQEEVHRDLIQLYLASGQPSAALRQYRTCEELLRQELAIEPAPETRALLSRVLALRQPPVSLAATRAPARLTPRPELAGVAAQLEELAATCESLRAGLAHATELLARLTAEVTGAPAVSEPRLRKVVG